MRYITAIVDPEYMSVGGFGHVFYDVLTAYIMSHLYKLTFVYSSIHSLGNKHHTGEQAGYEGDAINWDNFLQFGKNEVRIEDLADLNLSKARINLCGPFLSMDIQKLTSFISSHTDNTLFVLTNNNRIYMNELYHFNPDAYSAVFRKLKQKQMHISRPKGNKVTVAMHIRRGDWDWQPLSYNVEFIKLWRAVRKRKNYVINIYSLGTDKQLNEIKRALGPLDSNVVFHFNTDVYETYSGIYNADIVVGGHSNFPKIITLFSNSKFVYLPYNDGVIPPLGSHKKHKRYYFGNHPELFDIENRVETDIYLRKNRGKLIEIISGS